MAKEFYISNKSNRSLPIIDSRSVSENDIDASYDERGNLLKLSGSQDLHWNYRDNIAYVDIITRPSGKNDSEYYVYDSGGQRVRKVTETYQNNETNSTRVEKIYFGDIEVTRTYQKSGLIKEKYTAHVADDKSRVALHHYWTKGTPDETQNSQSRYQLSNHLDSVALELNDNAEIMTYEEYLPFGGTALIAGKTAREVTEKEYRYSGKERDESTGLYYYGARYYATWLLRWINPDPAGTVDGPNLYLFVGGNPVTYKDIDGKALDVNFSLDEEFGNEAEEQVPNEQLVPAGLLDQVAEYDQRYSLASTVLTQVKRALPLGAGNQIADLLRTQGSSYSRTTKLHESLENVADHRKKVIETYAAQSGTCDNFALLSSYLIVINRMDTPVRMVSTPPGERHSGHTFTLIGDERQKEPIVVDPWVILPEVHTLTDSIFFSARIGLASSHTVSFHNYSGSEINFSGNFISHSEVISLRTQNYNQVSNDDDDKKLAKIIQTSRNIGNKPFFWNQRISSSRSSNILQVFNDEYTKTSNFIGRYNLQRHIAEI